MATTDNFAEDARLDRQLRIEGWNQSALENARIAVVGDDDLLSSVFLMSLSALGVNRAVVIAPSLHPAFVEIARGVNAFFELAHLQGFYTHSSLDDLFGGCRVIVDLSHYGLANKLLLAKGFLEGIPIVRGFCCEQLDEQGFKVFTYVRGREWREIEQLISPQNLPAQHFDDAVLDTIIAGIVLEETKNLLMGRVVSDEIIAYHRHTLTSAAKADHLLVVGAGALGVFVGMGLAHSGYHNITFMDPDTVDVTNLNRQVLFYDAVGESKAQALARKLNELCRVNSRGRVEAFAATTDLAAYDAVFDCVDNFEARIALSERCEEKGKVLISGGTSAEAGQVVVYTPAEKGPTPAQLLGLYDIVAGRPGEHHRKERASCVHQPDPSVIMTNQIAAGFMVDSYRVLSSGQEPENIFYNSRSHERILKERRHLT
ncbi:HesA/MoeB/ThiF family protein [Desulfoferrobacter suflitae]|uniref:HesA/MoeB/ThiF family protein n=1 Tax=Desulfoferrobacter suflitae TaxID=2865782 RepID=UPI002164315E|nr:ThiF family adenylyltransferase [Desulfoferrobacter suflitae]MCK8602230.1 ThiF family adenylyltransferase [Desulfoferrobacter suflitae]